jgi:ubiquinone/menaquinone biosynthesis C-methylase UbiE
MSTTDIFQNITQQDAGTLDMIVNRLELRHRDPRFVAMCDAYLDRIELAKAARVLDFGCGSGVVGRQILRRPEFKGRVIGIDLSAPLIEAGRRLAAEEGVAERLDLRVGDAHGVGLGDAYFDAVVAHTLISHVREPLAVLREAARLLKPGGRLVVFDGDYASLTFGHPDVQLAKAMDEAVVSTIVAQPRVMREMLPLLRQAGLTPLDVLPGLVADVGGGCTMWPNGAESFGPVVARLGIMPAERVNAWLADLRQALAEGRFFASCNYYAYVAMRP